MEKRDISSMNLGELTAALEEISAQSGTKIEKFRSKQIYGWLVKGVYSFDEMGNVPAAVKKVLDEYFFIICFLFHFCWLLNS